jgi:outer membrane murein-binding lipoprotein Lpp
MDTIDNMISSPDADNIRLALMILKGETRTLENILRVDKAILNLYGMTRNAAKPYNGMSLTAKDSKTFRGKLTEIHEFVFMFISPERLASFAYNSNYYSNESSIWFSVNDLAYYFFILYVKLEVIPNQNPEEFYNHYYKVERPFNRETHQSKSQPFTLFEFYNSINERLTEYINESLSTIINDLEGKVSNLENDIEEITAMNENLEDQIQDLKSEIDNLESELDDARSNL